MKGLIDSIDDFNEASCQNGNQFKFWHVFLNNVASVLIYFNRSHREGNLDMHLSAVRRAIPLFYSSIVSITNAGYHGLLKIA